MSEIRDDQHEHTTKILTGKPGRPKGVTVVGAKKTDVKGTEIVGRGYKGVKVVDKSTSTDHGTVEINQGEENGQD